MKQLLKWRYDPSRIYWLWKNISPEFRIKNLSDKAKSLVIILEDLSHPIKNFTHWIAWNIKANSVIPENMLEIWIMLCKELPMDFINMQVQNHQCFKNTIINIQYIH